MGIANDLIHGLRMLRHQPGFVVTVIVVLGLGIGASTAIFSVVHGVLLQALPFGEPERIVRVWNTDVPERSDVSPLSVNEAVEYKRRNRVFEAFAAYHWRSVAVSGSTGAVQVRAARVMDGFFATMGVPATDGRTFRREEDRPGADDVVVLSHGLWARLGADPAAVGSTLLVDGRPRTIVGVMPTEFTFPAGSELWIPMAIDESRLDAETILSHGLGAVARLREGVGIEVAQEEMDRVVQSLADTYPDHIDETNGALLVPIHDSLVGRARPALMALLGAVGFLLLIGCTNVANLMLARLETRRREIAIRGALGAGRFRIVRQMLTESVLLSAVGGAFGVALTWWGMDLLRGILPAALPRRDEIAVDPAVLLFALGLSVATGLLFGVFPALRVTRSDPYPTLKEGGRGAAGSRDWFRSGLVVAEVGLVLVLTVGAGMMLKSVMHLWEVDPGWNAENVLTFEVSLPESRYRGEEAVVAYYDRLMESLEGMSDVSAAGAISWLPFADYPSNWGVEITTPVPEDAPPGPDYALVSGDYFRAMGIQVLRGRGLDESDRGATPGVVVTESMAKAYWPDGDVIGRQLRMHTDPVWRTIVGVVADHQNRSLHQSPRAGIFVPTGEITTGSPFLPRSMTVTLRSRTGDAAALVAGARSAVAALDAEVPMARVQTMQQVVDRVLGPSRSLMRLLMGFAVLGLVLGCVGVYGVISFGVAQRTREFGIRVALGARAAQLVNLVVSRTLGLIGVGVAGGLLAAWAAGRAALAGLLFEVQPGDPTVLASVAGLVAAVALLAALLPALRAARVDPLAALRDE